MVLFPWRKSRAPGLTNHGPRRPSIEVGWNHVSDMAHTPLHGGDNPHPRTRHIAGMTPNNQGKFYALIPAAAVHLRFPTEDVMDDSRLINISPNIRVLRSSTPIFLSYASAPELHLVPKYTGKSVGANGHPYHGRSPWSLARGNKEEISQTEYGSPVVN